MNEIELLGEAERQVLEMLSAKGEWGCEPKELARSMSIMWQRTVTWQQMARIVGDLKDLGYARITRSGGPRSWKMTTYAISPIGERVLAGDQ